MRYKCREIESALKKKGFVEIRNKNHKRFYYTCENGRTIVKTITSHGNPEYWGTLLSKMTSQLSSLPRPISRPY